MKKKRGGWGAFAPTNAEDDGLRSNFKVWLNDIWKNKDDLISAESFK